LGCEHDCGTITPGKRADLVVVSVGGCGEPHEALITADSQIVRTLCGGQMG